MKKITLIILVISFFLGKLHAQDGYTYTLVHNGNFSFTISAVPNTSVSNFATSVQSYGFTIIVPDGVTASITSSLGNGAGATFFNGTDVGDPNNDGYLITETLGSPISLPAPSSAMNSPMVTIQVNGSPTAGTISILANDSPLATTVTPLKSFMSADMVDDGMAMFPNVVDPNASGLSGTTSYMFNTLSTPTLELVEISIYPNPATNIIRIKGLENNLKRIEVYNITGQKVMTETNNLENIDVSDYAAGMYLIKIELKTENTVIKRFVKQ